MKAEIGDWISFYRNAVIVIGAVRYIRKSVIGTVYYCTDIGEVMDESVMEVRKVIASC
jgi:hypothetical protein